MPLRLSFLLKHARASLLVLLVVVLPLQSVAQLAAGLHEHGGVFHRHSAGAADVLEVGDATDESQQAGATALLAWLPALPALPARVAAGDHPRTAPLDWRDRLVAPPLAPPRG